MRKNVLLSSRFYHQQFHLRNDASQEISFTLTSLKSHFPLRKKKQVFRNISHAPHANVIRGPPGSVVAEFSYFFFVSLAGFIINKSTSDLFKLTLGIYVSEIWGFNIKVNRTLGNDAPDVPINKWGGNIGLKLWMQSHFCILKWMQMLTQLLKFILHPFNFNTSFWLIEIIF